MCLIDPADGEGGRDALVAALHGAGVLGVEGAALLVDHDAVLFQVVEACRAYLPGNACRMDDRRVHIYFENALKYIRRCEEEYDLIIVDSSDPFGPSEGLFTREFYGSCFNALKEDGIMVNQQGSPFYAEEAMRLWLRCMALASSV